MRASFCVLALLGTLACGSESTSTSAATGAEAGGGSGGALAGGGGEGTGGAPADPSIRVLTWNLEHFPKTENTVAGIVSVLEQTKPDIVGVQEIDDLSQWEQLDQTLSEYGAITASSGDGFARVGLLYRQARVNLGEVETLFANDSYAFPRPVLKARVRSVENPEHDFVFGVVHLKATLDDESLARRRDACEKLDLWVRTAAQNGVDSEFVIAGDWNDQLTDSAQYNAFGPLLTLEGSSFLTLPLEQQGAFSYLPFESFIDHVFVFGDPTLGTSDAQVVAADEFVPLYEANVSDHLPVLATLRFAP